MKIYETKSNFPKIYQENDTFFILTSDNDTLLITNYDKNTGKYDYLMDTGFYDSIADLVKTHKNTTSTEIALSIHSDTNKYKLIKQFKTLTEFEKDHPELLI